MKKIREVREARKTRAIVDGSADDGSDAAKANSRSASRDDKGREG